MKIKRQYFKAVDLVKELKGEIDRLHKEYEWSFFHEDDELKLENIISFIKMRKNSIEHLETMMKGIREVVGKETMRKWRQEYKEMKSRCCM